MFLERHLGISDTQLSTMLKTLKVKNLQTLIQKVVPNEILIKDLALPKAIDEEDLLKELNSLAKKNLLYKNFIGQGYYHTHTPSVIMRSVFSNPAWYTAYTPYQSEISQGRLEALLNFQTMVSDLTGMEIANASLLDESSACAEAMMMAYRIIHQTDANAHKIKFFVDKNIYPQHISVLKTRALPLNIQLVIDDIKNIDFIDDHFFGGIVAHINNLGSIQDIKSAINIIHKYNGLACITTDLLALTLLESPGVLGADIVLGNSQRFGVPLGYGGPHAAFFASKKDFIRQMPGRIIGVSLDALGNIAYRMTLQTREQHIKRDKATSNICTAQALLAIMASFYACYNGPKRLQETAKRIFVYHQQLKTALLKAGYKIIKNESWDTIAIEQDSSNVFSIQQLQQRALKNKTNFNYIDNKYITLSIDETTTLKDIQIIYKIFTDKTLQISKKDLVETPVLISHKRTTSFLTHSVFNTYHTETEMLRYIKHLEMKDLSLCHSMIPLGSCTMKLNPASSMIPLSNEHWLNIHPFVPKDQAKGYTTIIDTLSAYLKTITGFDGVSFQPNSGAQGEYAGLMVMRAYFEHNKQSQRKKMLIPMSAHGTNPASAALCGFDIVPVLCDDKGNVDIENLKQQIALHQHAIAGLMITYPSTHGIYENNITLICKHIHDAGGLVYMDGANMNAQVGLTNPATIGADVCHLNLHKTFAIPHGGGGPGMGPVLVKDFLVPFLPQHHLDTPHPHNAISATPFGSSLILLISYAYIKLLGKEGCKKSSIYAILNANYIKEKVKNDFNIVYTGQNDNVAHEVIIDIRPFKKTANIEAIDVAKRLIDFGFHPPTLGFPIPGTLMIEPTESESLQELDRFCNALHIIKKEIIEIEQGHMPQDNNVLKNAPHPIQVLTQDEWNKPYSREKAVYPDKNLKNKKMWPTIARINDTYGDRNIFCTCPSMQTL